MLIDCSVYLSMRLSFPLSVRTDIKIFLLNPILLYHNVLYHHSKQSNSSDIYMCIIMFSHCLLCRSHFYFYVNLSCLYVIVLLTKNCRCLRHIKPLFYSVSSDLRPLPPPPSQKTCHFRNGHF